MLNYVFYVRAQDWSCSVKGCGDDSFYQSGNIYAFQRSMNFIENLSCPSHTKTDYRRYCYQNWLLVELTGLGEFQRTR